MKHQLLAIIASDAPWQYYNKFEGYLKQLNHPFLQRIVFYRDYNLTITEDVIKQYGAVAFYYHDPLASLYPAVYHYAKQIEAVCQTNKIPLINQPDALSNTIKSVQLNLLQNARFTVAKAFPFTNVQELANVLPTDYPLFIRINDGHDSQGRFIQGPFDSFDALLAAYQPFEYHQSLHHQHTVALQWIDTPQINGYYRKCRCLATQHDVINAYTYFSHSWYIHGQNAVKNQASALANEQFINATVTDSEKAFFIKANKVLGLDFCAYDFAYTHDGNIVIWEANPHPAFLSMSDAEPIRSRIAHLLCSYYASFLPPLPFHLRMKNKLHTLWR